MNLSRRTFTKFLALSSMGSLAACTRTSSQLSLQAPWINDAEFLGYFVALQNGYYGKHEVDFKYLPGGPDKIADQILFAKKADIALTNPETTVALIVNEKAPFKIIGTQYQRSPLGVVSLEENGIRGPQDLIGKRLAVPAANRITVAAFLKANAIPIEKVSLVPYAYDPSVLLDGRCDATVDFVTNVPFVIEQAGKKASSFLFYDHKLKLFMDTVVVREDVLKERRKEIVGFLSASREGWNESFKDSKKYIDLFMGSHFRGTGRTVENELVFQKNQRPLIESPQGIFHMSEESISDCVRSLNDIGLRATPAMFDTTILAELQ